MSESFLTYQPKSALLKKYINWYYFHEEKDAMEDKRIVYYPTTNVGITIYKNSEVFFKPPYSVAFPNSKVDYFFCFTTAYSQSGVAEIRAPFRKIGILFKPFGLNQFINEPLTNLTKKQSIGSIDCFTSSMKPTLDAVFNETDENARIQLLDSYFESRFAIVDQPVVDKIVNIVRESEEKVKVQDLSIELNLNRRTLLRTFQTHMNCTLRDYIKVDRFRKMFNGCASSSNNLSLTQLSLQFGYYDQAEFNKDFKKLTNSTPTKTLNEITAMADNHIFWKK